MKPPEDPDAFEDEEQFEPDANESGDSDLHDSKATVEADLPEALLDPPDAGGRRDDSLFAYLLALAISIGLISLPAGQHDLRFTLLWMALAGYGVMAWLLTDLDRIERETTENLAWGLAFALILAGPLLAFGGNTLGVISLRLFGDMRAGPVLALLVFAMPLAETLFFRGVLQQRYAFWLTGLMASLWSLLLYLPLLEIMRFPAIALIVALALLMMNLLYSYVRQRNGLAAAWFCQIGVNLVLLFLPYLANQGA